MVKSIQLLATQPQHLSEAERHDDEERPAQAQRHRTDREPKDRRNDAGERDCEVDRQPGPHRQQRGSVGSDAEERGVPERKLTDVTDDQIQARRQHHREHDHDPDVQGVFVVDCERGQRAQRGHSEENIAFELHHARSALRLNRP
ncbi:hypothetical protein ACVWWK_007475 [Bradyrhizobium sp. LB9.1b]